MAFAYARIYRSMFAHWLWLVFSTGNFPVHPVYRRFLGLDWKRVEDCYPYPYAG